MPESEKKRSRAARTRRLNRILQPVGFDRRGGEWIMDTPDLRWWVSLETAKHDSHSHDLAIGALILRGGEPDFDAIQPATFGLSDLPGASRREYRDVDEAGEDPLILDVEVLLIPLIERLPTIESVIQMWLAGEVAHGNVWSSHPLQVWKAWRIATETDNDMLADRALRMAHTIRWTAEARQLLIGLGMPLVGPVHDSKEYHLFDRFIQREYTKRFSPVTDATRLPLF